MNYRSRLVAMILPAAMYLTSLIVPVVDPFVSPYSSPQSGATAFQIGWRSMYLHDETGWPVDRIELVAAWWANPAIWAAIGSYVLGWRRLAIISAGTAAVLAMSVVPRWWQELIEHPGFWLWWGSAIVVLLMAMFALPRRATAFAEDYGPLAPSPLRPELIPANPLTPDVP